jgi:hypothetical protein
MTYDMQDELDQLLLVRKGLSQSLCELQARQRELPPAAAALAPAVKALQEQLKAVDHQIAALTKAPERPAVQQLQKVPGIGPVTAATLVSRLTARSFSHADQFVAYCGRLLWLRRSHPPKRPEERAIGTEQARRSGMETPGGMETPVVFSCPSWAAS